MTDPARVWRTFALSAAYNAAKAAINQMAFTMANELAPHRINVNVIEPGWTDTPGERQFASDAELQAVAVTLPWGRLGQPAGGGLGLLAFAPLSVRIGRRAAFAVMHLGALVVVPSTCYLPATYTQLLLLLPVFGFLTLGMHAGYAIYFPELFPTHLRATGAGFCFNVGRIIAAPLLFLSADIKARAGDDLPRAVTALGFIYALGLVASLFLPETQGQPLPEGI